MSAIGWSAGDIIKLLEYSAKVYSAFQDANRNSTRQVQILIDEFNRFHDFLLQLKLLLDRHGKPLPFGYQEFKKTLKECEEFLGWYSDRLIDRKKSVQKGWATIKFVWEDRDVERLRKQVAGHVQSLQLYINFLNLEAQYEANATARYLAVPSPGKEIQDPVVPITFFNKGKSPASRNISTTDRDALQETEDVYEEILRFRQYLQRKSNQPSPPQISPRESPERQPSLSIEDREAVIARLRQEVESTLTNAQQVVDEMKEVGSQFNHDHARAPDNALGIVHTPHGSPEIRISAFPEEMWSTVQAGKRPQRSNTRQTYDSAISGMNSPDLSGEPSSAASIRSRADSEALFHNPWDGRLEDGSTFPRPDSISSASILTTSTVSSMGTPSKYPSFSGAAVTPGATPLTSPIDATRNASESSLHDLRLPQPAIEWELVSENALVEYTTEQGPRKPTACVISKRARERGGLIVRATLTNPKGSIYLECSGTRPPIPFAVNGLRNEKETYISFFADSSCGFNPPSIRSIRYTLFSNTESSTLQSSIYSKSLQFSRNIKIVKSNKYDAECRNQCIRLFSDQGIVMLVFFTNTRSEGSGKDKNCWIEEPHIAFERIPESKIPQSTDVLKLDFSKNPSETAQGKTRTTSTASDHSVVPSFLRRSHTSSSVASRDSVVSHTSTTSTIHPTNKHKLKWLEITFKSKEDRKEFVRVWQAHCRPLMDFS